MNCTSSMDIPTRDLNIEDTNTDNPSVSDQLLLAVFWEERLFNSIRDLSGTATGFGQMRFRMCEALTLARQRTNA